MITTQTNTFYGEGVLPLCLVRGGDWSASSFSLYLFVSLPHGRKKKGFLIILDRVQNVTELHFFDRKGYQTVKVSLHGKTTLYLLFSC